MSEQEFLENVVPQQLIRCCTQVALRQALASNDSHVELGRVLRGLTRIESAKTTETLADHERRQTLAVVAD